MLVPIMESPLSHEGKRITDYSRYFNTEASRRIVLPIQKEEEYKKLTPRESQVWMAGGLPNDIQFPVVKATFTSRDGSEININPEEMKTALQYCDYKGLPLLREWVEGLYKRVHNPPTMDGQQLPSSLALQICSGGREGVSKTLATVLEEGDCFLGEGVLYQCIMPMYVPRSIKCMTIRSDEEGMDAGHLKQVLTEWKEGTQGRRPRLLYADPTCNNPTGIAWSTRRKREIYDVARQFDLLILEDDPYYFLQFKKPLSPCLLSMDTDGRVIRVDSFSKTLSSGCRVGILFGPKQIIDNIRLAIFPDTAGSSGLSQMMIYKVVQTWGYDLYLQHLDKLATLYKQRADKAIQLATKYLTGLCEWRNPDGGMFIWLKILGVDNSDFVLEEVMKRGVFLVSGSLFTTTRSPIPYIRMSYARVSDDELEKGISVLADVVKRVTHQL